MDPYRYVHYYNAQLGGGPYFVGAPVQYGQNGRGLGSLFSRLFRFITPMVKSGINIARPHIANAAKSAAKNIVSDMTAAAVKRMTAPSPTGGESRQEGKGFRSLILKRRIIPPGLRTYKKRKRVERRSLRKRSIKKRRKPRANKKFIF